MAGVKFQRFLGKVPRLAPELIPDMAAQEARNVKLYSGDLIPYSEPVVAAQHGYTGAPAQTIYPLRTPVDWAAGSGLWDDAAPWDDLGLWADGTLDTLRWLAWGTDVDVVTPAELESTTEQRFYYTGDGVPKVSTYALATSGSPPYPNDYYELGLPLPELKPTATAASFEARTISSIARDTGGTVTVTTGGEIKEITNITQANPAVVTCAGHGYTGAEQVYISSVGGMTEVNDTTYTIAVLSDDTFFLRDNGTLVPIDSTGWGAYTSGGTVAAISADHDLKDGALVTVAGFTTLPCTYSQVDTTITVTLEDHGLSVGDKVLLRFSSGTATDNNFTVSRIAGADDFEVESTETLTTSGDATLDISSFNASSIEITVIGPRSFSYPSPGFELATTTNFDGRVNLAGATQARTYLYTWYTPWNEESIGSEPSDPVYIKEGQTVTIGNLPTDKPIDPAKNNVTGIRLYRTLSTTSDTEYLRLTNLYFPMAATVDPVSPATEGTITTATQHSRAVGDYIKVVCSGGDVFIAEVKTIVSDTEFDYDVTSGTAAAESATVYFGYRETTDDSWNYWGDGGDYDFVDNYSAFSLLNALATDDYEPPPADLKGLTVFNNNTLVGFTQNELWFSVPGEYHAWPRGYKRTLPEPIVAIATVSGYLLVLTTGYPYLLSGSDPAVLSLQRVDARYPCLSKRSVATVDGGVIYATHDGLAVYSTASGPQLLTKLLYSSEQWNEDIVSQGIIAAYYRGIYTAWFSSTGITLSQDQETGGYFTDLVMPHEPSCTVYDLRTNQLFYSAGIEGDIYLWDDTDQPPQQFRWRSKVVETPRPINLGAAQVDADYEETSPAWADVTDTWAGTSLPWVTSGGVTFYLWAGGELILTRQVSDRRAFRLPAGYLADTFEVEVDSSVRVRSVRVAETSSGLREV